MTIPMCMSVLTVTMFLFMLCMDKTDLLMRFVNHQVHTAFLWAMCIIGLFSMPFVITAIVAFLRYVDKADRFRRRYPGVS